MNEETPMNHDEQPVGPGHVHPPEDAPAALDYIHHERDKTRASLRNTIIGSVVVAGLLSGYVLYLTARFRTSLEPREAATITQGLISQRVDQQGPQIQAYLKEEVPKYIRQAPDLAMRELPNFRERIQTQVNDDIAKYAKEGSARLETQFDAFLENNKEPVGALIKNAQDPAATEKIASALKEEFVKFLDTAPDGKESLKAKLDATLSNMEKIQARMARLARNKALLPQEKSARRAIAILMRTIDQKRVEEGKTEPIAPAAMNQAAEQIRGATTPR